MKSTPVTTNAAETANPQSISNPYQSPTAMQPGLAADTEFLVSEKYIVGNHNIQLPAVCIATGQRNDLEPQTRQFGTVPGFIYQLRFLVVVLSCMGVFLAVLLTALLRQKLPDIPWEHSVMFVCGAGVSAVVALSIVGFVLREKVTVHWSVSQPLLKHRRFRRRILKVFAAVTIATSLICVGTEIVPANQAVPTLILVLAILTILSTRQPFQIPAPEVRGTSEGLFVLSGLSDQFLSVVRQMIEDYTSHRES